MGLTFPSALASALGLLAVPASTLAQEPTLAAFAAEATGEAERFADVGVAIAEGYRKLGPDFPGMGEHWINPTLVIRGELDPARPPVLAYALVGSERKLVGLAYTHVLGPDDAPPEAPFPVEAWHDHTGGVDEESLLLVGAASVHGGAEGFRLAMVHFWSPVENADGLLEQNNWALPFLRVGLAAPERPTEAAARALSTVGDGLSFYRHLLEVGVGLEDGDLETVLMLFGEASQRAARWLKTQPRDTAPTPGALGELGGVWTDLWSRLKEDVSAEVFARLEVLNPSVSGAPS